MQVKITYLENRKYKVTVVREVENAKEFEELIKELEEKGSIEKIASDFRKVDEEKVESKIECVVSITNKLYHGVLFVDEDFTWELKAVSDDMKKAKEYFTQLVNEKLQETKIESEGFDYVIFEDGTEIWGVDGLGEVVSGEKAFAVVGEDGEGFKCMEVCSDRSSALRALEIIKKDYLNDGFRIEREYDDVVIFNNDDVYKIQEVKKI